MPGLIAIDHRSPFAGDVSDTNRQRIAPQYNDPSQNVSLGENSEKFACVIDYTNGPDISRRHKLSSVLNSGRGVHRVRLAIFNDMSDEHHGLSLLGIRSGC